MFLNYKEALQLGLASEKSTIITVQPLITSKYARQKDNLDKSAQ